MQRAPSEGAVDRKWPERTLLIVSPVTGRGGSEEYLLKVAAAAVRCGWSATTAFAATPHTASLVRDLHDAGVGFEHAELIETAWKGSRGLRERRLHRATYTALVRRYAPARVLLVLPGIEQGMGLLSAMADSPVPAVVVYQLVQCPLAFGRATRAAYRRAYSRGRAWVTVSRNNRDLLARSLGWCPSAFHVIPNGAAPPPVLTPSEREATRSAVRIELGLPPGARIVLTVGRLAEQKGYDWLLPVLPHVRRSDSDAYFVWVGDGPSWMPLMKRAFELGVGERLLTLGVRADVHRLMAASDLFVFPSRFEGQPFALLEAMASGLPIVTTDASGIRELVENEQHAIVVPCDDQVALLDAIRRALRQPARMVELGRAARARWAAEFTSEGMIRSTLDLVDNPHPPAAAPRDPRAKRPPQSIVILGAGTGGRLALPRLALRSHILAFGDNDPAKWHTSIEGVEVLPIREALDLPYDRLVLATTARHAVVRQLMGLGVDPARCDVIPPETLHAWVNEG